MRASVGTSSGCAYVRSIASRARSSRRLDSSTARLIGLFGPEVGTISASLFSVLGAPKATTSAPSGPPAIPRVTSPGTRMASHACSSTTSSSSLNCALPETTR